MKRIWSFLSKTFHDATGQPSATLATAFGVNLWVALVLPIGWLTGKWPPVEILLVIVSYAALLLGLDFNVTKTKIQAESPTPAVNINADTANVTTAQPDSQ